MVAVHAPDNSQPIRAVLFAIAGMVTFSLQDTIIKWVSGTYPLHEAVLIRSCFGLLLTLVFAHFEGGLAILKTRRLGLHVLRGGFIVICNAAYFVALATMPLAEAMALFFVAPLFITLLSGPLLGERVGWRRWLAVGIGMLGVVIMVRPSGAVIEYVALLPLIAALGYAGTQLMTRRLGATDGASTMSFYIQLALLAASAVMGLVVGDGRFAGGGQANMEFFAARLDYANAGRHRFVRRLRFHRGDWRVRDFPGLPAGGRDHCGAIRISGAAFRGFMGLSDLGRLPRPVHFSWHRADRRRRPDRHLARPHRRLTPALGRSQADGGAPASAWKSPSMPRNTAL